MNLELKLPNENELKEEFGKTTALVSAEVTAVNTQSLDNSITVVID